VPREISARGRTRIWNYKKYERKPDDGYMDFTTTNDNGELERDIQRFASHAERGRADSESNFA
jgi:hypothetical protein